MKNNNLPIYVVLLVCQFMASISYAADSSQGASTSSGDNIAQPVIDQQDMQKKMEQMMKMFQNQMNPGANLTPDQRKQ